MGATGVILLLCGARVKRGGSRRLGAMAASISRYHFAGAACSMRSIIICIMVSIISMRFSIAW